MVPICRFPRPVTDLKLGQTLHTAEGLTIHAGLPHAPGPCVRHSSSPTSRGWGGTSGPQVLLSLAALKCSCLAGLLRWNSVLHPRRGGLEHRAAAAAGLGRLAGNPWRGCCTGLRRSGCGRWCSSGVAMSGGRWSSRFSWVLFAHEPCARRTGYPRSGDRLRSTVTAATGLS